MEYQPERLPLVIGVTGHRDLRIEDIPLLEREVGAILSRLRRDYVGEDEENPVILLSSLAEGADQIVARVALTHGAHLIAPLPMPPDEYRRDFQPGLAPGAAAEFDRLMAQASAAPVMPFTEGNSLDGVRADVNKRNEQYRAVGLFIVQNCDVLIALWDGNEDDKAVGGTTEVVGLKRYGVPLGISGSAHASLDESEVGPVIHVLTPRNRPASRDDTVVVRAWGRRTVKHGRGGVIRKVFALITEFAAHLFGVELKDATRHLPAVQRRELEAWNNFEALIALTREFNSESMALATESRGGHRISQSIDCLFSDPESGHVDQDAKQGAMAAVPGWCRLYGIADTLAQDRQAEFKRDWALLFVIGFFAFVLFALFSHVAMDSNVLIAGYSVFVALLYCVYIRARFKRHQERFLDYRALAEALRVAIYWHILGIRQHRSDGRAPVDENAVAHDVDNVTVTSYYPIKQPNELAWVKNCIRTLEKLRAPKRVNSENGLSQSAHSVARRSWVNGQLSYFKRQGLRHNRRGELLEGWAHVLLFITPFFLVPLLLSVIGETMWLGFGLHYVFLVAIGILPGLAAALTGYSERLALTAQTRQYDRMRRLFERAYELLPEQIDATSMESVRSLYRELGIEAVKENAEWVAIYRQRPIRPTQ